MPDWVKRVNKERAADIGSDQVIAATYYQAAGSASAMLRYGMATGLERQRGNGQRIDVEDRAAESGRRALEDAAARLDRPEGSHAAAIPAAPGVLAVTLGRLIFFGFRQGGLRTRIEDPVLVLDRRELVAWTYQPDSLSATIALAFSDGSDTAIEVPRANRPGRFAETLGIPNAG